MSADKLLFVRRAVFDDKISEEGLWMGEPGRGLRVGWHLMFFPNGQLMAAGEWANGKRVGYHDRWFPDGRLAETGEFDKDRRVGVHKFWSEQDDDEEVFKRDFGRV